MMLGTKEKVVTKVTLEFFSVIPVFEKIILLFQKRFPVMHILYDSLCDILKKLMGGFSNHRLLKASMDHDLASVECRNVQLQLANKEILIRESTLKALKDVTADQQKRALLGM